MAKYLDAIELSNNLKNRLEEIVLSSINVRDEELQNELSEIIKSNDGLISEILVEGVFSAKKHDDILRNIPFLNKKFLDLLDLNKVFNPNRIANAKNEFGDDEVAVAMAVAAGTPLAKLTQGQT